MVRTSRGWYPALIVFLLMSILYVATRVRVYVIKDQVVNVTVTKPLEITVEQSR